MKNGGVESVALVGNVGEGYPNLYVISEHAFTLLKLIDGKECEEATQHPP